MKSLSVFLVLGAVVALVLLVVSVHKRLFLPMPETVDQLVEESRAKPPAAPPVQLDIPYHSDRRGEYTLDLYAPLRDRSSDGDGGPHPVILYYHGGSWIGGDKITIRVIDRFLTRMRREGYFVAAVGYAAQPLGNISEAVEHGRAAWDWALANAEQFGFDRERIALYGVSAGGHVALMVASTLDPGGVQPVFVFAESSPTDLLSMRAGDAFSRSWVFHLFSRKRLARLSPITYVERALPPILLFHGDSDEVVDVNQSRRYTEAVREAGGTADLFVYEGGGHAFLNLPDEMWYKQESTALAWFQEHLSEKERAP